MYSLCACFMAWFAHQVPSTHTHTHTVYHFVLSVRNNGSSVARCKFASSFARKKSEMKINRKRIQNSCAYFSLVGMFCVVLGHVFHSIADSTRILTNRWRILYIIQQHNQSQHFMHNRKSEFFCFTLRLLADNSNCTHFNRSDALELPWDACIELEMDASEELGEECLRVNSSYRLRSDLSTHTSPNHSLHSFSLYFRKANE